MIALVWPVSLSRLMLNITMLRAHTTTTTTTSSTNCYSNDTLTTARTVLATLTEVIISLQDGFIQT